MSESNRVEIIRTPHLHPIGYLYTPGCDTADRHSLIWPPASLEPARRIAAATWSVELVTRHLRSDDFRAIAIATGAERIPATMSTLDGYHFGPKGLDRIFTLARERAAAKDTTRAKAKQVHDIKHQAAIDQARTSGQRVEIERWMDECDDPREECSLDVVTRWAQPDGTVTVTRQHTH